MSLAVDMLVPAFLLSALAFACLHLLRDAPPRIRFVIALAGLGAWIVPWPLIHVPLELARTPAPPLEPIASIGLTRDVIPADEPAGAEPSAWLPYVLIAVFAPGLFRLAGDWRRFRATIRRLRQESRSGESLRALLPDDLRATRTAIRIVPGSRVALASGVLRPTVWIGDAFASRADLELALVHECTHVRAHDPFWITLITTVERAYWWNPLVAALSRQAVLMSEAACDRRCSARFGRPQYIERLAALMLDADAAAAPRLLAAARGNGLDVHRLELLGRSMRLRARDCALMLAFTAAGAAYAGSHVIEPPKPAWSRVTVPATPAGRTLTTLLEAFETGDTQLLGSYLGAYTPQELAWPLAGFTHGVELVDIVTSEPFRIEYLVRDGRDGAIGLGRLELTDSARPRTAATDSDARAPADSAVKAP